MTSIFEYENYREFLRDAKGRKSLQRWAGELGYRSPRSIAMVLKGQRHPSRDMVRLFQDNLALSDKGKRYFALLVEHGRLIEQNKSDPKILSEISDLRSEGEPPTIIDASTQRLLAKWFVLPLKQLCVRPDFRRDSAWISEQLRHKVSETEIHYALEVLENTGILIWNESEEKYSLGVARSLRTAADVPSQVVREHHKEMMTRAIESLEEQALSERQFSTLTMRLSESRIPEAKEFVRMFVQEFNHKFSLQDSNANGDKEKVYQLNVQMFSHTKDN